MMRPSRRSFRGFFIADAMASMVVLSAIILALGVAMHGQRRVAARCAELRVSAEIAERVAVELLTTGIAPEAIGEARVRTREVESTPAGAWTEIVVTLNGRDFSLFVLVPAKPSPVEREPRP